MKDNFVNLELSYANMDTYYPRKKSYESILKYKSNFNGDFLDAGCGQMPYRIFIENDSAVTNYVGLDLAYDEGYSGTQVKPDATWDGITMPFTDASFDSAMSTQVLEHCPEPKIYLAEVSRVLKKGGAFYLSVPFMWNLHDVPHDEFRYTPYSLKRLLTEAGFTNIEIEATGGWHAAMGTLIGAYVNRAPISNKSRGLLKRIALPIVKFLMRKGEKENLKFRESLMITGLDVICKKRQ
jgi:SAM-dependent methyltransferase